MDAPRWFVLRISSRSSYWLLTIRMDSDGRSAMYWRLYEMHGYRIVRHHLDCLSWPLWVTKFNLKVLLCKPIRTLLTQNLKHIGKILLRSECNSYIQFLSGKPGSLKNTSTNLCVRVSIRFASLYVDLSPPCYRIRILIQWSSLDIGLLSLW